MAENWRQLDSEGYERMFMYNGAHLSPYQLHAMVFYDQVHALVYRDQKLTVGNDTMPREVYYFRAEKRQYGIIFTHCLN